MSSPLRRFTATLVALVLAACGAEEPEPVREEVQRDLAQIRARDTLTMLTRYNSTGYFVYRAEPMGFEYELLRAFADDQDLVLETRVVRDRDDLLDHLLRGEGDVAAARLIPAHLEEAEVAFTNGLYQTRPVLVQQTAPPARARLPEAVDTVLESRPPTFPDLPAAQREPVQVRARLISRPAELAGERVYVPNSEYLDRLVEVSDSISGDIEVVEIEGDASTEALIRSVARGGIELGAAPQNLAQLKASYFTNLEVRPTLGPVHEVAWAVRPSSPELLAELDRWLATDSVQALAESLYDKYFRDRRGFQERVESEYLSSETGRLSQYDALLREGARELGWDWRLLASQAYQESKFDPTARSWAGAQGLLQLMPGTAREVGVSDPNNPEQNVAGAVRYTRGLMDQWADEIPDPAERLRFVLASYNVGRGHVLDAQRLAAKHGDDPLVWEDVSYWLLQKSKKSVYTDPVVRHGFARGLEPVTYVAKILERFDHYRQFVSGEEPEAGR